MLRMEGEKNENFYFNQPDGELLARYLKGQRQARAFVQTEETDLEQVLA